MNIINSLLFLFISINLVAAENRTTLGDKSPVIENITGDVIINYREEAAKENNSYNKKQTYEKKDSVIIVEKFSNMNIKEIHNFEFIYPKYRQDILFLFVTYSLELEKKINSSTIEKSTPSTFSDLFIINENNIDRLYHELSFSPSEAQAIKVIRHNKKIYFYIYGISGSGAVLTGGFYKIDEMNQLLKINISDKLRILEGCKDPSLINEKIFLSCSGEIFIIKYKEGKFVLENYESIIEYPDLGWSKHILKITSCEDIKIKFDYRFIEMIKDENTSDEIIMRSKKTYKLELEEEIIITSEVRFFRSVISSGGIFKVRKTKIYSELFVVKKGEGEVIIRCDFDKRAVINFIVE